MSSVGRWVLGVSFFVKSELLDIVGFSIVCDYDVLCIVCCLLVVCCLSFDVSWLLVIGRWLLVIGHWLLVVGGCWLLHNIGC